MSQLAFGPFALDLRTSVLSKHGAMTPLSPKLVQVLGCLAEARGELITRDLLFERHWPGLTVTDNTLTRAIADIRKVLDDDPGAPEYIQTIARRGYRFLADVRVEAAAPEPAHAGLVAVPQGLAGLEPFLAWERGRMALESLQVQALPAAAEAFSRAVVGAPHYAAAHAGLANAHIFRFEATRVDNAPALEAVATAEQAARRATELDPALGEGWAALGHALTCAGRVEDARAALRQAVALEPRNWRHHYRLAAGVWGEERLRSVERAEALLPGFPGAQTLAAMVLVARQAFDAAATAAARGVTAQSAQHDHSLYPANGLLWVRGLTHAARGDLASATADFMAEATFSSAADTVYARECRVLASESLAFGHLLAGRRGEALTALAAADAASNGHARAVLGVAVGEDHAVDAVARVAGACAELERAGKHAERTLVLASAEAWSGNATGGLALLDKALSTPAADATAWSLPAEPMFAPLRAADGYARLAARLAARAA